MFDERHASDLRARAADALMEAAEEFDPLEHGQQTLVVELVRLFYKLMRVADEIEAATNKLRELEVSNLAA